MMRKIRMNNKGVSTIIAAALIVALTVILAVALGSTVLSSAPQATAQYQLQIKGEASATGDIVLTHLGGDPVSLDSISIKTFIPTGTYEGVVYTVPMSVYSSGYEWEGTWYASSFNTPSGDALLQAGDTLTMSFVDSFDTGTYGLMAPSGGEQFVVEFYYNNQPITTTTIITQP